MAVRAGKDVTYTYNSQLFSVLTGGSLNRQKTIEDTTPFGVADQTQGSAMLRKIADVPIEVLYDDVSTVDAVMQAAYLDDLTHTLLIAWGGTKTSSVAAGVKSYERLPNVGKISRLRVTLYTSGAVTEV